MRQRVESQKICDFRKAVVFADKLFAFLDFKFEIIIYYGFAGALAEGFAQGRFTVMQLFRNNVEANFPVNVLFENSDDFVLDCVRIFDF